jgi:hypothetical protein
MVLVLFIVFPSHNKTQAGTVEQWLRHTLNKTREIPPPSVAEYRPGGGKVVKKAVVDKGQHIKWDIRDPNCTTTLRYASTWRKPRSTRPP